MTQGLARRAVQVACGVATQPVSPVKLSHPTLLAKKKTSPLTSSIHIFFLPFMSAWPAAARAGHREGLRVRTAADGRLE